MSAQLIGNSVKSWKTYYDLGRVLREGQAALDDMATWRQNMMDSILMRTTADADEEIVEGAEEDEEHEQANMDEDADGAGLIREDFD
jgi:hypothetical protein